MSTDELQRLERRVAAALHDTDDRPVDVRAGRSVLGERLGRQQQQVRRWAVIGVAASVLAVVVTVSLVMSSLRDHPEGFPVAPPRVTLSPSGLPVGVLTGTVDRSEKGAVSRLRIVVRADGTGTWNSGTTGDREGPSVADYPVTFVDDGPGHAIVRWATGACYSRDAVMLTFTVRGRTLHIDQAETSCLVSRGLGRDLDGTTLRIRPLPRELSPSGLPVGLLEGQLTRSSGPDDVTTVRLLVRADGSGSVRGSGLTGGTTRFAADGFEVLFVPAGPGVAGVQYDGPGCPTAW